MVLVKGGPSSGGTGVPGGSNKQIQFNDSGSFAGDEKLTWDKTVSNLVISGIAVLSGCVSTVLTGVQPYATSSTTLNTNLNADLLDGKNTGTSGNAIPLLDGANTWSAAQTLSTDTKLLFRDSTNYIHSNASNEVTLVAASNLTVSGLTLTTIGVAGNTALGDSTLRIVYPQTDNKIDLGDSTHRFNSLFVGTITITDSANIVSNTTTGTKIGTSVSQKFGLWNATPIIQPASANQAALSLDLDVTGADLVDKAAINSNFTSIQTLLNQLRTDLVNAGMIKGSA